MKQKQTFLTQAQLRQIFANDWSDFQSDILNHVFCHHCVSETKMVNYQAYLNDLNDLVIQGNCATCHKPVSRYLATSENPTYFSRIMKLVSNKNEGRHS